MTSAREWVAVAAALITGLALRLHTLAAANAWWDEALAIWAVRKGLAGVTAWTAGDVHPPMYFWQLAIWVSLVGEAEFASRALTALTGVALIAVTYALGRRAGGRAGGVTAAWLAALAPLLVWWSMELRMYATAGLFLALALALALRWQAGAAGATALVAYGVSAWAALHTVYLAAAGVGMVALAILAACRHDRARRRDWVLANVAVALASLPWLAYALPRMSSWSSVAEPATIAFTTQLWLTLLATGRSAAIEAALLATAVFWSAAAVGVLAAATRGPWRPRGSGRPESRVAAACMSLFLIVPPVVVWMATQPRSLFYSPGLEARYFVPFAAPALALAAAGAGTAWRTWRPAGAAAALIMLVVAASSLPAHYAGRRWHDGLAAIAGAIWSQARDGDGVLLVSGNRYPMFRHVYDRRAPPGSTGLAYGYASPLDPEGTPLPPSPAKLAAPAGRPPVYEIPEAGGGQMGEYEWQRELEDLMERHPRLWLVELESHLQDPDGDVEKWLAARRTRVLSEGYGPDALHLFSEDGRAPDAAAVDAHMSGLFAGDSGRVVWTGPVAREAQPGDQVNLAVAAQRAPEPVRLVGPDGVEVLRAGWTAARGADAGAGAVGAGNTTDGGGTAATGASRLRYRAVLDITERVPAGNYSLVSDVTCRQSSVPDARARDDDAQGTRAVDGTECLRLRVGGSPPASEVRPAGVRFGDASDALPTLAGIGLGSPAAGRVMTVDLLWDELATGDRGPAAGASDPVAFAHLLGPSRADGSTVWAGEDVPLPDWSSGASATAQRMMRLLLPVPADLPAGRYDLEIGLYDGRNGERYEVRSGDVSATDAAYSVDEPARRIVLSDIVVP